MHTVMEIGASIPAFLGKLWKLVEDPETDDLICWSPNGRSFFIRNQARFARELLPHYYKHNNMASFVRQLNMYGFHKKISVELGGLKCDKDEMEFAHQYFYKGHPYLLEHIKRKIAAHKGQESSNPPMKTELMNKMLTEVRNMRGRQEQLDSKLGAMKRENEALWRELAMLRQKHLKQQQIVNKLIHFLVTLVQPSRRGGLLVKRQFPLMIDDSRRQHIKRTKVSSKVQASPKGGPVIHELDGSEPELDSQYFTAEDLENHTDPTIESPEHNPSFLLGTDASGGIEFPNDILQSNNDLEPENSLKKKHVKEKKKRKNNVPIKILIPSTENREDSREEILRTALPEESTSSATSFSNNGTKTSKAVPLASARSSKLAAMAANMSKSVNDLEMEVLDSASADDAMEKDDATFMKLEDIVALSQDQDDSNIDHIMENCSDSPSSAKSLESNLDYLSNIGTTALSGSEEADENEEAGTSSAAKNNLSLSCVDSISDGPDSSYRLGSHVQDMDTHLENVETELDNLRDMLRSEGYSIDVNTLLGLFGADDPMSFGIPVDPELNPNYNDKEHENKFESTYESGGGKLVTYNSASNLLDLDDMFLGATSSSPGGDAELQNNENDPCASLDMDDKSALINLLALNDTNSSMLQ